MEYKPKVYNFPLKDCRQHSFCEHPSTDDQALHYAVDLKSYVRSASPNKRPDLREREIVTATSMPNEFDLKYLKSIQEQMDDLNSVRPGIPIVTEEGLSDWCQQSMNRRFQMIPPTRPFLMSKPMYEYLKSVQELTHEPSANVVNDKELMTVAEIQAITQRKPVAMRVLQPRTMENGTPFIYPRQKAKKKPQNSLESVSISEPKSRARIRSAKRTTIFARDAKLEAIHESGQQETTKYNPLYKMDTGLAKQVFEITKKKIKFFQNLAFSSAFLGRIIDNQKSINFMVPPEFRTPLIEQKDIPDHPSTLDIYGHLIEPRDAEDNGFDCLKNEKWSEASTIFKVKLKIDPTLFDAQCGLAFALEHMSCYKLSRKWLIEALKSEPENFSVIFSLAVTSLKLNELGNCIHFCKHVLEVCPPIALGDFYYLLSVCYRMLGNMKECNNYYQLLIEMNEPKTSIFTSFHLNDWDEQIKTLPTWILSRSDIPFFRRFKPKQIKRLCSQKIKKIDAMSIFILESGKSYIVLKGSLRLRDHSLKYSMPQMTWKVQTGQYINYFSHNLFYISMNYWITADSLGCILLEIPAESFTELSRESRTNKEIVNMHLLHSFPIFRDISLETLEALVIESMKIKKCHKGQVVRKKLDDRRIEKKNLFGVIITGICDLKRDDGIDISLLGRGDCFGEEFIFKHIQGFASLGNLIVRSDNLEVGFISPQDLQRLPEYELSKIEAALRKNPHIQRSVQQVNSSFASHGRSQSTKF